MPYGSGLSTVAFGGLGLATGVYLVGSNLLSWMILGAFTAVLLTVAAFRIFAIARSK